MLDRNESAKLEINNCDLFGSISQNQIAELLPFVNVKRARYGQFISLFQSGARKLIGVRNGVFKVVEVDSDGNEFFKLIAFKGDLFGGILTSNINDYAYVISKEAVFFSVDYSDFNNWLNRHPDLFKIYHDKLGDLINSMQEWYFNMMRLDVKSRLLFFFSVLAKKEGIHIENHTTIEKRFTQDDLASLLYTSRQSIVRVLNELNAEGRVSFSRRTIELADVENDRHGFVLVGLK